MNPTAVTWVMIAATTAVAVGAGVGYGFYRKRKKKVLPPPPGDDKKPGGGGGGGGGGGPKACNYADCHIALANLKPPQQASPFVWPHKDAWPNNRNLGTQLEVFGYDVGNVNAGDWNMVRKTAMDATAGFQHDYNLVRKAVLAGVIERDHQPTAPNLGNPDGLFGTNTANALYDALQWSATAPWKQLVDQASANA